MKIFLDKLEIRDWPFVVEFQHRGFTIRTRGPEFVWVGVSPTDENKRIPDGVVVLVGAKTIPDAIKAVDKIADAIELGLIVLEDRDA